MAAEHLKGMKDAIMSGTGGGLQSTSQTVGEMVAGQSDTRSSSQKKADAANVSLGELSNPKGTGQTTEGTPIEGGQQMLNMQTGSADHLDLNLRKQS